MKSLGHHLFGFSVGIANVLIRWKCKESYSVLLRIYGSHLVAKRDNNKFMFIVRPWRHPKKPVILKELHENLINRRNHRSERSVCWLKLCCQREIIIFVYPTTSRSDDQQFFIARPPFVNTVYKAQWTTQEESMGFVTFPLVFHHAY